METNVSRSFLTSLLRVSDVYEALPSTQLSVSLLIPSEEFKNSLSNGIIEFSPLLYETPRFFILAARIPLPERLPSAELALPHEGKAFVRFSNPKIFDFSEEEIRRFRKFNEEFFRLCERGVNELLTCELRPYADSDSEMFFLIPAIALSQNLSENSKYSKDFVIHRKYVEEFPNCPVNPSISTLMTLLSTEFTHETRDKCLEICLSLLSDAKHIKSIETLQNSLRNLLIFAEDNEFYYFITRFCTELTAEIRIETEENIEMTFFEHLQRKYEKLQINARQSLFKVKYFKLAPCNAHLCNSTAAWEITGNDDLRPREPIISMKTNGAVYVAPQTVLIAPFTQHTLRFLRIFPSIMIHTTSALLAHKLRSSYISDAVSLTALVRGMRAPSCGEFNALEYERLEHLGDVVLNYSVLKRLYTENTAFGRVELDYYRSVLISNIHLFYASVKNGIFRYFRATLLRFSYWTLSRGFLRKVRVTNGAKEKMEKWYAEIETEKVSLKMLADHVEVLIGICMGESLECAEAFIEEIGLLGSHCRGIEALERHRSEIMRFCDVEFPGECRGISAVRNDLITKQNCVGKFNLIFTRLFKKSAEKKMVFTGDTSVPEYTAFVQLDPEAVFTAAATGKSKKIAWKEAVFHVMTEIQKREDEFAALVRRYSPHLLSEGYSFRDIVSGKTKTALKKKVRKFDLRKQVKALNSEFEIDVSQGPGRRTYSDVTPILSLEGSVRSAKAFVVELSHRELKRPPRVKYSSLDEGYCAKVSFGARGELCAEGTGRAKRIAEAEAFVALRDVIFANFEWKRIISRVIGEKKCEYDRVRAQMRSEETGSEEIIVAKSPSLRKYRPLLESFDALLATVQQCFGYEIRRVSFHLLCELFTVKEGRLGNERVAALGNSAVHLVVVKLLLKDPRTRGLDPGRLTIARLHVVQHEVVSEHCVRLGLVDFIEHCEDWLEERILYGKLVESEYPSCFSSLFMGVCGVILVDLGFDIRRFQVAVETALRPVLEKVLDDPLLVH